MSYQPITKASVDQAQPLTFEKPAEKQANITIELAPDGLHIKAEYTGSLSSIPAAIERLKAAGLVELVTASAPAPTAPAPAAKAARPKGETYFDADGDECCSLHKRPLSQGKFGPYCGAKARPGEVADKNGFCGLKFN